MLSIKNIAGALGMFATAVIGLPALAADMPTEPSSNYNYTATTPEFLNMMVRLRAISVNPDEDAFVKNGGAPIAGANVDISNQVMPELDITYFFNEHWAVEMICCVTPHNVRGAGALAGLGELASVTLFPPTVLLQYHLNPGGRFKPYIGAGVNYTVFFNEKAGPGAYALGAVDVDFDNAFGFALQAGVDVALTDRMYLNFDVKKLYLNTDVAFVGTPITADVDIDPWIFGVGVGYRFSSSEIFGN